MPTLYVVATPIGNLSDISARALDILRQVSIVAAEDTRVTGNLLRHFDISAKMTSLHRHNEAGKSQGIIERMVAENIDAALVSDAGTPAISDPGYLLVETAWAAGISVVPIPGATALASALSICGFDTREFAFYGFSPRETGALRKKLLDIFQTGIPIAILYESPHRILSLMACITETLPGCMTCVCCDLTKLYEKITRGTAEMALASLRADAKVEKGEYCVILDLSGVSIETEAAVPPTSIEAQLFDCLLSGASLQDAIASVTARGARKNDVKRASLRLKGYLSTTDDEA